MSKPANQVSAMAAIFRGIIMSDALKMVMATSWFKFEWSQQTIHATLVSKIKTQKCVAPLPDIKRLSFFFISWRDVFQYWEDLDIIKE